MNLIAADVVVSMSLLSLATGLLVALTTQWKLARYYGMRAKLALTVIAASLLMLHQFLVVDAAARRVSGTAGALPDMRTVAGRSTPHSDARCFS